MNKVEQVWTMNKVEQVWPKVLAQVGPMLASELQKAEAISVIGDNCLVARFAKQYQTEYEFCTEHLRRKRIEDAFKTITGRTWTVTIELLDEVALNNGALVQSGSIEHDRLRFRSRTETRIYEALKRRKVLFFPLPAAVLGGKVEVEKREPDFLICLDGRWGILEVMGDEFHPPETAMQEHERARLFKEYGLLCIEFYDARRCYNHTDEVVDEFLKILARS